MSHDRFPLPRPLSSEWRGEIRESLTRLSHEQHQDLAAITTRQKL